MRQLGTMPVKCLDLSPLRSTWLRRCLSSRESSSPSLRVPPHPPRHLTCLAGLVSSSTGMGGKRCYCSAGTHHPNHRRRRASRQQHLLPPQRLVLPALHKHVSRKLHPEIYGVTRRGQLRADPTLEATAPSNRQRAPGLAEDNVRLRLLVLRRQTSIREQSTHPGCLLGKPIRKVL